MKNSIKKMRVKSFSLRLLSVLMITVLLVSTGCRKDDEAPADPPVVYQVENPLQAYYAATGFSVTTKFINSGNYEFGLVFSPNVKGSIKAITAMLPDANPTLKVTIWDFDTKTALRTEVVNVATANSLVTKEITELALEKDKKYVITMNSNDWYERKKADNSNAAYPVTAGNIKFYEYRWLSAPTNPTFPTKVALNYNGGDVSFNFQQTP